MNDAPAALVSVVIPTYNYARFLGRALQSVCDQTYENWEAIVIDNHSIDNTDQVIASFTDTRITCIKIHNNGVIAVSRNAGLRAAKGEWIAFLDSDDWWTSDKLQVCFASINEKVDLVYHDLEIISNKPRIFSRKLIKSWQLKAPVLMDMLLRGNAIANSSVIVRKSLIEKIGGINVCREMMAAEDYHTWMRISKFTNNFLYIPNRLGYYSEHDNNISQKDMSLPVRHAVNEFLGLLTDRQSLKLDANLTFLSIKYSYLKGDYIAIKKSFIFTLCNARLITRIKVLLLIMKIYILKWTRLSVH